MNRSYLLTAAAAVPMLLVLSAANAAPAPPARTALEQIERLSASVSDAAFRLQAKAESQMDADSHRDDLETVRTDINRIGVDLQALDRQRASLTEWEAKALDQALPLMQEAAFNAEAAMRAYSTGRTHLWATSYPREMAKISEDTEKVKDLVGGYLKLASVRQEEQRLEVKVGEGADTR